MFAKDAKPMDPASTTITPATAREGYVGFHWRSLGKTFRLRWSFGAIFCRPKQHDIEVKLFKNRSSQRARSVKIQQVVRCQAKKPAWFSWHPSSNQKQLGVSWYDCNQQQYVAWILWYCKPRYFILLFILNHGQTQLTNHVFNLERVLIGFVPLFWARRKSFSSPISGVPCEFQGA